MQNTIRTPAQNLQSKNALWSHANQASTALTTENTTLTDGRNEYTTERPSETT